MKRRGKDTEIATRKKQLEEKTRELDQHKEQFALLKQQVINSGSLSYWQAVDLKRKYEQCWTLVCKLERELKKISIDRVAMTLSSGGLRE